MNLNFSVRIMAVVAWLCYTLELLSKIRPIGIALQMLISFDKRHQPTHLKKNLHPPFKTN